MDNALLMYLKKMNKNFDENFLSIANQLSNIKITVDDILLGKNLSEWVSDLATSGKSSATYADSSRMQALAENTDACKNLQTSQHIFDWCVSKNQVGIYYKSFFGSVSGVTWNNIKTPAQACANVTAFKKIANDNTTFSTMIDNAISKKAIYTAYATTESIISGSSVAISVLTARQSGRKNVGGSYADEFEGKFFILGYEAKNVSSYCPVVYFTDGTNKRFESRTTGNLNRFATRVYTPRDTGYYPEFKFYYVDFS